MNKIILLLISTFFIACNAQVNTVGAQPKIIKTQRSVKQDNVHSALQDKAGNLWFGTTGEGIYRFDGKAFQQFTIKDGLNSNTVWAMLEDKDGILWIGTNKGICRYNGTQFEAVTILSTNNFLDNSQNTTVKNDVWSIIQTKNGLLWFGTTSGVYCYNGKVFTSFLSDKNIENSDKLNLKDVQCMLQDSNGNIWFGSGPMAFEGVSCYNGKTLTKLNLAGENWIRHILEDKNGVLWFATRRKGVWCYDGKTFAKFKIGDNFMGKNAGFTAFTTANTTEDDNGLAIMIDANGNIWFGGGEKNEIENDTGIWRYDGKKFTNFEPKNGLGNYAVFSFLQDKQGNIWVGTRNTGLYRYDGKAFESFSD